MAATDLRVGEFGGSTSTVDSGTSVNPLARQPSTFDYSQNNQFKIYLPIFPTTEWFVVRANIPGVSMSQASQYTPFVDVAVVGDKLQYDNFNMSFVVDESLENYMEMYNWVKNIGFPFKSLPTIVGADRVIVIFTRPSSYSLNQPVSFKFCLEIVNLRSVSS